MFRARRGPTGKNLMRKLAGIVLAVAGIALIANKVPVALWWLVLGGGLVYIGWKFYTC